MKKGKEKWTKEIEGANIELEELKKKLNMTEKMSSKERLDGLAMFLETIEGIKDVAMMNDLYRAIINSIEYTNNGDGEIHLKVNFK